MESHLILRTTFKNNGTSCLQQKVEDVDMNVSVSEFKGKASTLLGQQSAEIGKHSNMLLLIADVCKYSTDPTGACVDPPVMVGYWCPPFVHLCT